MHRTEVEDNMILLALTGSHSYGLATETSDYDYKGIFIAPTQYYIGIKNVEQKDSGWNEPGNGKFTMLDNNKDTVAYELRKYIQLAAKCNPNILELLFEDEQFLLFTNQWGRALIEHREMFLSKRARDTYAGYSHAQIKKVKTHRKWLLNPPKIKPEPSDFGLEQYGGGLSKAQLNAFLEFTWMLIRSRIEYLEEEQELYTFLQERIDIKGAIKNSPIPEECKDYLQNLTRSTDEFMALLTKTQQYRQELNHWNSYQSWKRNRNKDRAALEAKIGYDTKHAAHCIRLLRMGNEILLSGKVNVNRTFIDGDFLLNVRKGNVPYYVVEELADSLFVELETSYKHSTLPRSVDNKAIDNLLMNLVLDHNGLVD